MSNLLISQNLVQNPSFEKHNSKFKVKKWKLLSGINPKCQYPLFYFHEEYPYKPFSIPNHDNQKPHSGKAYIGVRFLLEDYLQSKLKKKLEKDSFYYISFYANLSDTSIYAISNFGIFFMNKKVKKKDRISSNKFEPSLVSSDIICDTINWTKVSGIYKAKGNEKYLVFGMVNTEKYLDDYDAIKKALKINNYQCKKPCPVLLILYNFDDFSVIKIHKKDIPKYKVGNYPVNKYDKLKVKQFNVRNRPVFSKVTPEKK